MCLFYIWSVQVIVWVDWLRNEMNWIYEGTVFFQNNFGLNSVLLDKKCIKENILHACTKTYVYCYLQIGCLYIYIYIYIPTPSLGQDMTQGQCFKQSLTGLNSEFTFSPSLKNLVCPVVKCNQSRPCPTTITITPRSPS